MTSPFVLALGEAALTIRLGETANVESAERAAALAGTIRRAQLEGVAEVVSAVASVTVYYELGDTRRTTTRDRTERLRMFVANATDELRADAPVVTHEIATRYDGPDLDEVAQRVQLSRDEVIKRHAAAVYHVLALGFLPGWAYLCPLDAALSLPRRTTPRTRVPAGSVAIMGSQTGIYPRVSPGGWHLIGSTDAALFDADRAQPALFAPGDRVRFNPIA